MTDLVEAHLATAPPRRPPLGFGLLAAAIASLGLWGGLFWFVGSVV